MVSWVRRWGGPKGSGKDPGDELPGLPGVFPSWRREVEGSGNWDFMPGWCQNGNLKEFGHTFRCGETSR